MTHAYPETYLNSAMGKLADVFDIAVNDFSLDANEFAKQFACSKTCRRLEDGDPSILLGKSGPEILFEYFAEEGRVVVREAHGVSPQYNRTPEYWAGWILAYVQWISGEKLLSILEKMSFSMLLQLYPALHEADVSKAAEVILARLPHGRSARKRYRRAMKKGI